MVLIDGLAPPQADRRRDPRADAAPPARTIACCRTTWRPCARRCSKCDVLLVDGEQRVSEVIKYLTQSTWSHAALYVGDELWRRYPERRAELDLRFGIDAEHLMVEALMEDGVIASPLAKYEELNLRVCRPRGLRPEDAGASSTRCWPRSAPATTCATPRSGALLLPGVADPAPLAPARARVRRRPHDRGHLLDADRARVPERRLPDPARRHPWRRSAGAPPLARLAPAQALPASLPSSAFRLITPRDFDLSPYFEIVKFNAARARAVRLPAHPLGVRASTGEPLYAGRDHWERPDASSLTPEVAPSIAPSGSPSSQCNRTCCSGSPRRSARCSNVA